VTISTKISPSQSDMTKIRKKLKFSNITKNGTAIFKLQHSAKTNRHILYDFPKKAIYLYYKGYKNDFTKFHSEKWIHTCNQSCENLSIKEHQYIRNI